MDPFTITFQPIHGGSFKPQLKAGQRYRHPFNDKRLDRRVKRSLSRLIQRRHSNVHRCSNHRKEIKAFYRLLSNNKIDLGELISELTQVDEELIRGRELYVPLDGCSINLKKGEGSRADWSESFGVIEDNRSAGFTIMPSLLLDAVDKSCYGLGDILFHSRTKLSGDAEEKKRQRAIRAKLPIEQKESAMWHLVAQQTAKRLTLARRVTFILDQGGDNYETFFYILEGTGRDIIVRMDEDRMMAELKTGLLGRSSHILEQQHIAANRLIYLRALNHFSKSSGKLRQRTAHLTNLQLKFCPVKVQPPGPRRADRPVFERPMSLIEVIEDPKTAIVGEAPVHWRLLTSWNITRAEEAWKAVEAYQRRWEIEQLFRVLKKEGYNIEGSELRKPQRIMKITAMALHASTLALELVAARDNTVFIPLSRYFDESQTKVLQLMNSTLSGPTEKTSNPHPQDSMAWAAWIVARAGGWSGYQSQRKPGPTTMMDGLREVEVLCRYAKKDVDT